MDSVYEYCPKCQATRDMVVTVSKREEVDLNGDAIEIITNNFHCETCRSFVRSEEIEQTVAEEMKDEEETEQV